MSLEGMSSHPMSSWNFTFFTFFVVEAILFRFFVRGKVVEPEGRAFCATSVEGKQAAVND